MSLRLALAGVCLSVGSCVSPGTPVEYTDPATGKTITTTAGDIAADQLDATGSIFTSLAGKALGIATGNPIVGLSGSALLAALLGTATARLRKKKQPEVEHDKAPTEGE